ncbi:hypothetical protein Tco_0717026 [Tanacetum coccineum]
MLQTFSQKLLMLVGDEAIHKELGDRMESVATTASSLEAGQDNGSGPRCQDTILGDVGAQTRKALTNEEKGKLFMEFMEKRRKHFAALRAQEKRNRPPTNSQKRSKMSTYLKHMGGYKYNQLKEKSYEEIQKLFDKEMKRHEEVEADGAAELKKHLVIVKDDDIAIDAIPLATKPPLIVEYELLKEGIMVHYELIRADGSSKRYSSMIRLL